MSTCHAKIAENISPRRVFGSRIILFNQDLGVFLPDNHMARSLKLSAEAFDRLLDWLAPDRETSAARYQEIHKRVTRLFSYKGVYCPEDLTDVVMDRVATKLGQESVPPFSDDHLKWFYSFSKYVYLEYLEEEQKKARNIALIRPDRANVQTNLETYEHRLRCLDQCMARLDQVKRELLLRYYGYAQGEKAKHREAIADELNIRMNALRIRISRIRSSLEDCVKQCVHGEGSRVSL